MLTKELEDRLVVWKKRLGLSDWSISVTYRDARDLNQSQARTIIQQTMQIADIRLMRPDDRQKCDPGDDSIELDLIHELIHVRLWSIDPEDLKGVEHSCREQSIEWIAKALFTTDRKNKE